MAQTTNLIVDSTEERKVFEWLNWDKNPDTKHEIEILWNSNPSEARNDQLKELLLSRMEFGTAGLRGRMGAGYSRMNDLVIIQTSQGMVSYLESIHTEQSKKRGIAIGYDGRHNSKRFADLTAGVFVRRGFCVYLFSNVCPTPFVPFCIGMKGCLAGIMVTASHNPKYDNGFKVYWENGTQIIPPQDRNIQTNILANLEPWANVWDTSCLTNNELVLDPLPQVSSAYMGVLKNNMLSLTANGILTAKITYTAMHGVGYRYMAQAFDVANFQPLVVVEQQRDPDPDFPTVEFPNPEEGKSALNLAIQTADENGSTLILANDPDADRLAVAEKDTKSDSGRWRIFSGNELGALLGWWLFYSHRMRHPDLPLENLFMLGSTVSTKFLQTMAKEEGFNYVETLTGFKWMGNKTHDLQRQGKTILFAFEEAIGFMCGTAVLDKDGISAGVHTAELVAYLATLNMTLSAKLEDLYTIYGYHISINSYYLCFEPSNIVRLFTKLRHFSGEPNTYPTLLADGKYIVQSVRDLTTGYDSSRPDKVAILPTSSSTQMITFIFDNGLVATLRTSGTEPKIKLYTELRATPSQGNVHALNKLLENMVQAIIKEYLEPDVYGLISKD